MGPDADARSFFHVGDDSMLGTLDVDTRNNLVRVLNRTTERAKGRNDRGLLEPWRFEPASANWWASARRPGIESPPRRAARPGAHFLRP